MKLFLIALNYPPVKSGDADYVINLCSYFKWKSEVDPYLITSNYPNTQSIQVTDDGIYIFRIMENWGISEIIKILKLIKKENPEIIQINYDNEYFISKFILVMLPFIIKKYKRNIKIVSCLFYNNEDAVPKIRLNLKKIINYSDNVIVNNDKDMNFILSCFPNFRKKLKKVYNRPNIVHNPGITVDRGEVRKRLKISEEGIILIYFGFINKDKRLDYLFRALRQVADQGKELKLLIIGAPFEIKNKEENIKYYEDLKKLSEALKLDNNVFWAGYCSPKDISMSLLSSDLAILPYKDGVSGKNTSFWSVLGHGIPTITTITKKDTPPELLVNKENVIFVSIDSVDELSEAIIKYIEEREAYKEIGNKGKKLISEKYSWENMVKELENIYKGDMV